MSQSYYTYVPSPIGKLLLTSDGEALTGVFMESHTGSTMIIPQGIQEDDHFEDLRDQFVDYFAGKRKTFSVKLKWNGTPFQMKVWQELLNIPYGTTISYGELAKRIGQPTASRAVGTANGLNPISIIVPCHRVIGANGKLTGYGGGLDRKEFLLKLEQS